MLKELHPKYKLTIEPYEHSRFNPIHESANGCVATVIDVECGERGWIAYRVENGLDPNYWHRIHTSMIDDIQEDEENNQIVILTQNAKYILIKIES